MVAHPIASHLEGKELKDYRDMERYDWYMVDGTKYPKGDPAISHIKGVNLFIDMNRSINESGNDRAGIVDYYWPNPDLEDKTIAYLKTSVVKLFPEWGWVVGTGGYIDNIQTDVANDNTPIAAKLDSSKNIQIGAVIIVAIIMSLIGLAITGIMKKSIASNVQRLRSMAKMERWILRSRRTNSPAGMSLGKLQGLFIAFR